MKPLMMFIMKKILLTGLPGVGKTTIIKKIVQNYKSGCAGFYTEEIRENNVRMGFKLITLDGNSCIMAHRNIRSPFRVGRYGVSLECIENLGVNAIKKAIAGKKIVVIDEIGKMELFSQKFRDAVLEALDSNCPVLATILYASTSFCDRIKNHPDVQIFEVTISNRNNLPGQIAKIFSG